MKGRLGESFVVSWRADPQYVVHQLGADALPFVFFRDFGVCQDNESLGFDVFDDGDVIAQVEFIALFVGIVDQRVFFSSITLRFR